MTGLQLYVLFDGTAREALEFYRSVFGGELALHTAAEFGRDDLPSTAIAHGELRGPVALAGADAGPDEEPVRIRGVMLSLLGTAEPAELHRWFRALAEGGEVLDPMQPRPWGDTDGQVVDRFGLRWLVGHEGVLEG